MKRALFHWDKGIKIESIVARTELLVIGHYFIHGLIPCVDISIVLVLFSRGSREVEIDRYLI
jgi:hypothetical protein